MHETSKSIFAKLRDSRYATRYLVGDGIDIGAGRDSLALYGEFFPLMRSCRSWDMPDGDAQYLASVPDATFDFVHSAHCLEHMVDPATALHHWLRILKPGGHLVCIVPDEDLYEQGVFPSSFNSDHKWTFTIAKRSSWSPVSVSLIDLLGSMREQAQVLKLELLDATFRRRIHELTSQVRVDQTTTPVGECGIEFIVQKLAP